MNKATICCLVMAFLTFSCASTSAAKAKGEKGEEAIESGWFEFGWLGGDEKPLLKLKLPSFMKKDWFCSEYKRIDGVHYCMTSDAGMLSVRGAFKENGREVIIDLSGSAYDFGKDPRKEGKTIGSEKQSEYGGYGRKFLFDYKEIELDGHDAYLLEIEDNRERGGINKYRRVIFYEYKNMFGEVDFAIGVRGADGKSIDALSHKEWSPRLRKFLDEIVTSVRFMRKVEE